MTPREKMVAEIERMEDTVNRTKSKHLRNDYLKGIKRLKRELAEYDRWRDGS